MERWTSKSNNEGVDDTTLEQFERGKSPVQVSSESLLIYLEDHQCLRTLCKEALKKLSALLAL